MVDYFSNSIEQHNKSKSSQRDMLIKLDQVKSELVGKRSKKETQKHLGMNGRVSIKKNNKPINSEIQPKLQKGR